MSRIPRILHRVWLDPDGTDPMPTLFEHFGRRARELNPEWIVHDWRSIDDVLSYIPPSAGGRLRHAQRYFPNDWKRFEVDLLRLDLLWYIGGWYVDTDVELHGSLDELQESIDVDEHGVVVGRSPQHIRGRHPITNCVMAAVPYHHYIGDLIVGIDQAIADNPGKSLAQTVGPWHLTRTYDRRSYPDVLVLEPEVLFGPAGRGGPFLTHYWNNARRKRGEGLG